MKSYKHGNKMSRRLGRVVLSLAVLAAVLIAGGYYGINKLYHHNLQPVDASSEEDISFTIESGSLTPRIAEVLYEKNLIRSTQAFSQYVRSKGVGQDFKAGTYKLRKSMSVQDIVSKLVKGDVANDLFTIIPGSNIAQIKKNFADNTHYSQDEIDAAFNPEAYSGHPALVDLPAGASLEGFLYPDSYQFIAETTPQTIIKQSLDEMAEALTPEIRAGIAQQGLSVYQGIILASIVEREVGERDSNGHVVDNRAKAAQVFIKRLNMGMKLQSNATDGYPPEYDTYTIDGLPPEPISSISNSSLAAVARPAGTNFLYFVSGSDCVTRFSETNEQHEELKAAHGIARPEDNCRG